MLRYFQQFRVKVTQVLAEFRLPALDLLTLLLSVRRKRFGNRQRRELLLQRRPLRPQFVRFDETIANRLLPAQGFAVYPGINDLLIDLCGLVLQLSVIDRLQLRLGQLGAFVLDCRQQCVDDPFLCRGCEQPLMGRVN